MLVLSVGCTRTLPLDTPANFVLDDAYTLYWTFVPGARSYDVRIEGEGGFSSTLNSHVTHVSLAELTEGDYGIYVMAIGGTDNDVRSEWSERVDFHKDRESGLLLTAINGNTEYAVTGVGTATGEVTIDEKFRGKPVTALADGAFRGKGSSRLTAVTVPESVTSIGEGAFYNCTNLTKVTLPDSVTTLGAKLFQGCSKLTSVKLPAALVSVPSNMFAYCRQLAHLDLPETVVSIGESAFYNCSSLSDMVLPDSVSYIGEHAFDSDQVLSSVTMGSGLTAIAPYAFCGCPALETVNFEEVEALSIDAHAFEDCTKLASVTLPAGLTSIGAYAFYRCSALETVSIPETVTAVGEFAFNDTALFAAQSEEGDDGFIYADKWLVAVTNDTKLALTALGTDTLKPDTVGIANYVFIASVPTDSGGVAVSGAPQLTEVTLTPSVRYLGEYAFYDCPKLGKFITEADSMLTIIHDRAFQKCGILKNVQFNGTHLADIGSYAFYDCPSLASGDRLIPSSVQRIGTYAFRDTLLYSNAAVAGADGVVYAGNWVVDYNASTTVSGSAIELKESTVGIADYAFYQNTAVQSITGLTNVEHIGRGAFFGCTALSLVPLGQNLTEIADNTFNGCTSLFLVYLPLSLKTIGLRAFSGCTMLDEIDLSATDVTAVGNYAFYNCFNVKTLKLNRKLETIGEYAFYGVNRITELTLPDSVTELGANAFAQCTALEKITVGNSLERIGAGAFQSCTALTSVTLPDSVLYIGGYAFYKCGALAEISLGSGLQEIGTYAFAATALASVTLPASLRSVADYAFKSCYELHSVLLLGVPAAVGIHAFYGSDTLTFYVAAAKEGTEDWNRRWNSGFRPVVWNCKTEEGESYVVSITTDPADIENPFARGGFSAPVREGYDFAGWALAPGGEVVYAADEWRKADMGTTLYAVWTEKAEDSAPEGAPETAPGGAGQE